MRVAYDAASAARVRRTIASDLTAYAVAADAVDDVVLVAGELVGNAVTHTADRAVSDDRFDVSWSLEADCVTLRVADGSATRPQLRHVGAEATNGRGLAIVAAVARDWGVEPVGAGKQVWARVPVHFGS